MKKTSGILHIQKIISLINPNNFSDELQKSLQSEKNACLEEAQRKSCINVKNKSADN